MHVCVEGVGGTGETDGVSPPYVCVCVCVRGDIRKFMRAGARMRGNCGRLKGERKKKGREWDGWKLGWG